MPRITCQHEWIFEIPNPTNNPFAYKTIGFELRGEYVTSAFYSDVVSAVSAYAHAPDAWNTPLWGGARESIPIGILRAVLTAWRAKRGDDKVSREVPFPPPPVLGCS